MLVRSVIIENNADDIHVSFLHASFIHIRAKKIVCDFLNQH